MSTALANQAPIFQLKASLYTLTTLHLLATDLGILNEQLAKLRQQAPKFLNNAPIIVDLQRLEQETHTKTVLDFKAFKQILAEQQLIIVGLRHVPEDAQAAAKEAGFALLPNAAQSKSGARSTELPTAKPLSTTSEKTHKNTQTTVNSSSASNLPAESASAQSTMLINKSVRSGQQIYAKGADLIVVGSVSPGAEIIADGNIHIYGALKGRALAGANGNEQARIFCQQLAAELVSIAGHYWLHDDVMSHAQGQSNVQIYLEEAHLTLAKLA